MKGLDTVVQTREAQIASIYLTQVVKVGQQLARATVWEIAATKRYAAAFILRAEK